MSPACSLHAPCIPPAEGTDLLQAAGMWEVHPVPPAAPPSPQPSLAGQPLPSLTILRTPRAPVCGRYSRRHRPHLRAVPTWPLHCRPVYGRCSTRADTARSDHRIHPLPLSVRHRPHAGPERVADGAFAHLAAALLMASELGGRKTVAQPARQVRQAAVAHPQWWHAPHARRRARSARVHSLPCIPARSARIRRRRPPPSTPRRRARSGLRGLRPFVGGASDLLLVAVRRPRALGLRRAHLGRISTCRLEPPLVDLAEPCG